MITFAKLSRSQSSRTSSRAIKSQAGDHRQEFQMARSLEACKKALLAYKDRMAALARLLERKLQDSFA